MTATALDRSRHGRPGGSPERRYTIRIDDRPVEVCLSPRAASALAARWRPLVAEMQLFFSCTIVKRVHFHDGNDAGTVAVDDRLRVGFRPLIKQVCDKETLFAGGGDITDFPIVDEARFIPKRLKLDYRQGEWRGTFEY